MPGGEGLPWSNLMSTAADVLPVGALELLPVSCPSSICVLLLHVSLPGITRFCFGHWPAFTEQQKHRTGYGHNNHRAGANLQGVKELSMGIVGVRSGRWPRHQQVGAALLQEGTAASTSGSWGTAPASWSCAKRLPLLSCGSGGRHWRAQAV